MLRNYCGLSLKRKLKIFCTKCYKKVKRETTSKLRRRQQARKSKTDDLSKL